MNAAAIHGKLDHVPGQDGMRPGDKARAHATRPVEFRAGDGPLIRIQPDFQLALERAPQSMVLSWVEDGQPMNAAIPVVEFNAFLSSGQIVIGA